MGGGVREASAVAAVAGTARLLARAGLVEGFGHVSLRADEGFLITGTVPFDAIGPGDVRALDAGGTSLGDSSDLPLEAPLHAAIYRARPDVSAICRTHSRWAVAWGARGLAPPLVHGLGGLAGDVALHPDPQLVTDGDRADAAARSLGASDCLLLRGNGALATAGTLPQAAVRAWFLEERSRVAAEAPGARFLEGNDLVTRSGAFEAERVRAERWLFGRFSDIDSARREPT
jgi:ribulose-5-phosphate 4-epimerase/fuculose-1-phosphate aldolase